MILLPMNSLLSDWHKLIEPPWAAVVLALVAVICGWVVGAERQKKEKPAGLRTMMLVCLGSAVFTMISFAFESQTGDSGRVAAQIVTGIGFLGAGAILRGPVSVTGLTTAATIWIVAATGMVVGAGYAVAGLALSVLVLAVLKLIAAWEDRLQRQLPLTSAVIVFDPDAGKATVRIEEALVEFHIAHRPTDFSDRPDGTRQLQLPECHANRHYREFLLTLADLPQVKEIRQRNPSSDKVG